MLVEDFPRVSLGTFPTPLLHAARFSAELGGPNVWIKRDDLTGFIIGSNKVRKLEFLLGDALARKANVLVAPGVLHGSTTRLAAMVARRLSLRAVLLLSRLDYPYRQGNLLLDLLPSAGGGGLDPDRLLGADVRLVDSYEEAKAMAEVVAEELRRQGEVPYVIPGGGSSGVGSVAYAECAREVQRQAQAQGFEVDCLICASASGSTQGGLALGVRAFDLPFSVWGISGSDRRAELCEKVARMASAGAALLGTAPLRAEDIVVFDEYAGPRYGEPTPEALEVIRWLARTERVLLDPVYTGKAMAALVDLTRKGVLTAGQNVVFLHSAGSPELFAYNPEYAELLSEVGQAAVDGGNR